MNKLRNLELTMVSGQKIKIREISYSRVEKYIKEKKIEVLKNGLMINFAFVESVKESLTLKINKKDK